MITPTHKFELEIDGLKVEGNINIGGEPCEIEITTADVDTKMEVFKVFNDILFQLTEYIKHSPEIKKIEIKEI